ncbi:MAG: type II toxin-antitoxin system VapC family toxin, partial [Acetobacteraceae bacterium]|nr:type II toxin-antitoxin system VapC family toxin [Acetobacteraceae bacterium]
RPPRDARWHDVLLDPEQEVHVSVVSLWEMALKSRIGKLDIDLGQVERICDEAGFRPLAILPPHLQALRALPQVEDHRDPFDHLLIAQAIAEGLVFLTADRRAARYPVRLLP